MGTFIIPRLIAYHPNAITPFTLVDFPRTYFGTKIMKTLAVQNYSASDAMFCAKAEINGERMV